MSAEEGPLSVAALQGAEQTPSWTGGKPDDGPKTDAVNCGQAAPAAAAASSPAQRGSGGAAALPCQNRNNSNKPAKRYRTKPVPGCEGLYTCSDNESATWQKLDGDTLQRWGKPSAADAKAAFHLRRNVEAFVRHWGRDRCLFFTVTDEANLHPKQFARRWNSYLVRHGKWIVSFIRVLEPQKQGRPHYHLLVAVPFDTLPDAFDWKAFDACQRERRQNGPSSAFRALRARYKASAAPELVALWSLLRKVLPRYGLGRAELLPLRKGREAISEYVGKYLEAGLQIRRHSWKGCRRVEFDRRAKDAWIACTRVFAWNSPGARLWRHRVGQIGMLLRVQDISDLSRYLGKRWGYQMREAITLSNDTEWALILDAVARTATLRTQLTNMSSHA